MSTEGQINPFYSQESVSEPLSIYSGACIALVGADSIDATCKIMCSWHPKMLIRIEIESNFLGNKDFSNVKVRIPAWFQEFYVQLEIITHSLNAHEETTVLSGKLHEVGFFLPSPDRRISNVAFHLINFSNISFYTDGNDGEILPTETLKFKCKDWEVELIKVPDLHEIEERLKYVNGFAITHYIYSQRLTSTELDVQNIVTELSEFLNYFLSFHRGLWISAALPIGFNPQGECVLRVLSGDKIDFWQDISSSSITKSSSELNLSFAIFWEVWQQPNWKDAIKMIIHWYIESNTLAGGLQGAIVQQQAAFERFAWALKENNLAFKGLSDKQLDFSLEASERIAALLEWCGLQQSVQPYNLHTIKYFETKQKVISGPELVVAIRTALVHPKPKRREVLDDVSPAMMEEVYRLGQNYLRHLIRKVMGLPQTLIIFPEYELKKNTP